MITVYALLCPFSGQPRYVGSALDMWARFASHRRESLQRWRSTPLYVWMLWLHDNFGEVPHIRSLQCAIPVECREQTEREWIELLSRKNELLNVRLLA
jgi:hypothetical protein